MTESGSQPTPGWYYAAGDPPGTQRYWDGSAWQGGPQPVGGGVGGIAAGPGGTVAAPGQRFVGFLIDGGISLAIVIVGFIVAAILGAVVDVLGGLMIAITYLGAIGFFIYNSVYLQGTTGQSIGKKQQGTKLVADATGQPVGAGMAFVRYLLGGLIAQLCWLDYWWILVDERNQRLSDKILKYQVLVA